jgi:hypothetical protein
VVTCPARTDTDPLQSAYPDLLTVRVYVPGFTFVKEYVPSEADVVDDTPLSATVAPEITADVDESVTMPDTVPVVGEGFEPMMLGQAFEMSLS